MVTSLIQKYNVPGPRYTSYPTVPYWDVLGQRSMISEETTNLSAIALEDMEVCFIPKSEILGFFDHNNEFSMNVMKTICGDLKDADDHVVSMGQKSAKERLAETLLYLHDSFGLNKDGSKLRKITQSL